MEAHKPAKTVDAQTQAAIDAFYAKNQCEHVLDHWSGPITGVGPTKAKAKQHAIRQGNLMKNKPPRGYLMAKSGETIVNTAEHKPRWFKLRSYESARWDKALNELVKQLPIYEISIRLNVKDSQVLNWKRGLTVPGPAMCDQLIELLSRYVPKSELGRCNLVNGQGR